MTGSITFPVLSNDRKYNIANIAKLSGDRKYYNTSQIAISRHGDKNQPWRSDSTK